MLAHSTVATMYTYRAYVDEHMLALLSSLDNSNRDNVLFRLRLELNHEQQHPDSAEFEKWE